MKYSNAEIAKNLNLWDEYFNTSAFMSDEEFEEMTYEERLKLLNDAFGPDEEGEQSSDEDQYVTDLW